MQKKIKKKTETVIKILDYLNILVNRGQNIYKKINIFVQKQKQKEEEFKLDTPLARIPTNKCYKINESFFFYLNRNILNIYSNIRANSEMFIYHSLCFFVLFCFVFAKYNQTRVGFECVFERCCFFETHTIELNIEIASQLIAGCLMHVNPLI